MYQGVSKVDILKDTLIINKTTFQRTIKSLQKNWIIIFTGLIYIALNMAMLLVINTLFRGVLFILAGIAMALASSALISNYLYLLENVINNKRLNFNDFKDGFTKYLRKIYGVFFIAWIGSFVLSLLQGALGNIINLIASIVIIIALNPLPEAIYQKNYSSSESIKYTFKFMKENWLNWFLPNIIFSFVLYVITGNLILNLFTTYIKLSSQTIIAYLIGQTVFSFMMIYRGHLFNILSTSTRRKRAYMNKFYD